MISGRLVFSPLALLRPSGAPCARPQSILIDPEARA